MQSFTRSSKARTIALAKAGRSAKLDYLQQSDEFKSMSVDDEFDFYEDMAKYNELCQSIVNRIVVDEETVPSKDRQPIVSFRTAVVAQLRKATGNEKADLIGEYLADEDEDGHITPRYILRRTA